MSCELLVAGSLFAAGKQVKKFDFFPVGLLLLSYRIPGFIENTTHANRGTGQVDVVLFFAVDFM
jgi:hypothetical protein